MQQSYWHYKEKEFTEAYSHEFGYYFNVVDNIKINGKPKQENRQLILDLTYVTGAHKKIRLLHGNRLVDK